jgi:hypothetical protein
MLKYSAVHAYRLEREGKQTAIVATLVAPSCLN